MFGPKTSSSLFSFGKVLNGMNKTLGLVNQVLPIYKEAKPIINNARNAFKILKEFSTSTTEQIITNKEKNIKPIKEIITNKKGPTFFQ